MPAVDRSEGRGHQRFSALNSKHIRAAEPPAGALAKPGRLGRRIQPVKPMTVSHQGLPMAEVSRYAVCRRAPVGPASTASTMETLRLEAPSLRFLGGEAVESPRRAAAACKE